MIQRNKFAFWGSLLLAVLLAEGCQNKADFFQREMESLMERSLTPDSRMISRQEIQHDQFSVKTRWDLETPLKWAEYKDFLKRRLESEFHIVVDDEACLDLRETFDCDVIDLRFAPGKKATRLSVRVTMTATAW